MATYPLQVELNEEKILKLQNFFIATQKEIEASLLGATDFSIENKKAILAQINAILDELAQAASKTLGEELPNYYMAGANNANAQLLNIRAPVDIIKSFNSIHFDAINAILDDTSKAFGESMTTISRSVDYLLNKVSRELLTEQMAQGVVRGDALKNIKSMLKGLIAEQGIYALKDKADRTWTLDRYAEMLFRTKAVEARNRGLINRMVEYGYDLVQVSAHPDSCLDCSSWQGKILSMRGLTRGYPTVAEAEAAGLFHPNCKHAINTLIPSLAHDTHSYETPNEFETKRDYVADPKLKARAKDLLRKAAEHDPEFQKLIEQIARGNEFDYSGGPVKSLDRILEKAVIEEGGKLENIFDINRAVIFVETPEQAQSVLDYMKRKYNLEFVRPGDIKDDFYRIGYQKALINFKLPYGGVGELQITTKEFWEAKIEKRGDILYNIVRSKMPQWELAEDKMNILYADAADIMRRNMERLAALL